MTACLIPTFGDLVAGAVLLTIVGVPARLYQLQRRADRRHSAWPPLPPNQRSPR